MDGMRRTVRLAEPRGFCSGVERALEAVAGALEKGPWPVCVLHEIVHNEHVVAALAARGVRFVDSPAEAPEGATLVFSAHGVSRKIEEQAKALKLAVVDASCPLVKSLHRKAEDFEAQGCKLILIGHREHREVAGVLGRLKGTAEVVISAEDIERLPAIEGRCACLSQTTLSSDEVASLTELLKAKIPGIVIGGDVCYATKERQDAVKRLAKDCDTILVVGSRKSSNSKRLQEVAEASGAKAFLIASAKELDAKMLEGAAAVGLTAGASAPEGLVCEVLAELERRGFSLTCP